ncbi:PIG-L deacetylase family protein [Parabacteroides distasonis]|uniref:PIG-L deacetylase family protein n=1 Tax=Parabacteroides distasonis TaxID=823 RepID=UPI001F5995DE|nr:PIG-L family deacetylase [Parabacteroides distasonis]MCR1853551.1 PIG-L family deacetylase [Parabacteroides distasonis]
MMFTYKRIMVVAAHPDDELLGLGATMHKLIEEQGVQTRVIILGEGITSRSDTRDMGLWKEALEKHHRNVEMARQLIGYHSVQAYNFSDNRFDSHALLDIVKVVEHEKEQFCPDFIFTHHGGDLNIDHQMTFQAVMTATRPMEDEQVKAIFTFETPSASEWQASCDPRHFMPNFYMEISEADLKAKCDAMAAYEFESRAFPHPRSAEALRILAQCRGYTVGKQLAEAFQLVRIIEC